MHKFRSCCEVLRLLLSELPNNQTAKDELRRAINRVAEQENGHYQFEKMYTQATKLRPPYLDHATYVGPVLVKATAFRGRGLFTTKEIKAGDLVLVEKAFAFAFISDDQSETNTSVMLNAETKRMTMGAQADLLKTMIRKLYRNPSLIPAITELHHGSYPMVQRSEVDSSPIVDT